MSFVGTTFGRALAGLGEGVASLGNRYIDDELQRQRAQAFADIQRNSAVQQAQQIDQYQNDPERLERMRGEKVKDVDATEAARLRGDVNRANSTELTDAEGRRAGSVARATAEATATAQRDATLLNGSDPNYIKALTKITAAQRDPGAAAMHAAQTALAQFQLASAKKVSALQDTLTDAIASGDTKTEEQTRLQLDALNGKNGKQAQFYTVAENAGKAMAPALKILADPASDAGAKEEAQQTIREQRALMNAAARRAGVDLTEAGKAPIPQGAVDLLKKDPGTREQFDAKYGAGRAAEILGGATASPPSAAPATRNAATAEPVDTRPSSMTGDAALNSITTQNEQRLAAVTDQYRAAKTELQAATKSGNPQTALAAAQKLQEIRNQYTSLANSLFGNNSQRYIDDLNRI